MPVSRYFPTHFLQFSAIYDYIFVIFLTVVNVKNAAAAALVVVPLLIVSVSDEKRVTSKPPFIVKPSFDTNVANGLGFLLLFYFSPPRLAVKTSSQSPPYDRKSEKRTRRERTRKGKFAKFVRPWQNLNSNNNQILSILINKNIIFKNDIKNKIRLKVQGFWNDENREARVVARFAGLT